MALRILYVCGDLGVPVGGTSGASTHVREFCHALQDAGHHVAILSPHPGDSSVVRVPVRAVPAPRAKWLGLDGRYILLDFQMARAVARAISELRPHLIYERNALYQRAATRLARRARIPRLVECNTELSREMESRLRVPAWARRAEHAMLRRSCGIIVNSRFNLRRLAFAAGVPEDRFVVSPNAVDPLRFRPETEPAPLRRELGLAEDTPLAGYVGSLTAWHGTDRLFEAAQVLARDGSRVVIVSVGGDDARLSRLTERAEREGVADRLRFLPPVPFDGVPALLAAFDLCLIPGTQDGSVPTKVFEYAAMARPMVIAHCETNEEVFGAQRDACAFWFERGDGAGLARQIGEALADSAEAARRGATAREVILAGYTWEHNIERMIALARRCGLREG